MDLRIRLIQRRVSVRGCLEQSMGTINKKTACFGIYTARWNMEARTDDEFVFHSRNNSNDIHVNKDINTIETDEIPDIDLLCGGFHVRIILWPKPQTRRKYPGKEGCLWWDIRRIIEEKQPKIVLLENVDRLLKSPTSQRGEISPSCWRVWMSWDM